ncbi:tryptophan-rich sensory protein [Planctomycetaceae bacterium SH139]
MINAKHSPSSAGLRYVLQRPVLVSLYPLMVDITLLWLVLGATLIAFWKVNRQAGFLLVPYLAWVSFAAFLNFTLWQMN